MSSLYVNDGTPYEVVWLEPAYDQSAGIRFQEQTGWYFWYHGESEPRLVGPFTSEMRALEAAKSGVKNVE